MSINTLYLLLISLIITKQYENNFKPTIGIYAMPYPTNDYSIYNQTLVGISYIRWLESSGANVLIIQQWYSNETFDEILNKINGIILHGGTRNVVFGTNHTWENGLEYIYYKSLEKKIPIFGICLGLSIIGRLVEDQKYVCEYGFNNIHIIRGFNVTDYNSKMFSLFNESLLNSLYENSAYYNHRWAINMTTFDKNINLKNMLKITSISNDNESKEFINSFEGINDYLYGTQFHPEKTPFQRKNESDFDNVKLDHEIIYEKNSIRVSTLLGIFFVEECRKNKNRFDLKDKDKYYFIDSYGNNNQNMTINYTREIYIFSMNNKKKIMHSNILYYLIYAIIIFIIIIIIIKNYLLNKKRKTIINLDKEKEKMKEKEKENNLKISPQNEESNLLKKL